MNANINSGRNLIFFVIDSSVMKEYANMIENMKNELFR
jgi:hypothetical protein